jgi:hypothetical protein
MSAGMKVDVPDRRRATTSTARIFTLISRVTIHLTKNAAALSAICFGRVTRAANRETLRPQIESALKTISRIKLGRLP